MQKSHEVSVGKLYEGNPTVHFRGCLFGRPKSSQKFGFSSQEILKFPWAKRQLKYLVIPEMQFRPLVRGTQRRFSLRSFETLF